MSKYQFPLLKDEKEFESLVNDLCREKFDIEFQVYGRKGQNQNGIDGTSFSSNRKQIVYQCKNKFIIRDEQKIRKELIADIENEVISANKKFSNIDTFIFANSYKQDTLIQDKAVELSTKYGFSVISWSWEEIEGLLEIHLNVAKKYYPEIFDKNILSENDIKQRFQENSLTLLSSQNLYIQNSFIEIPEINKINDFISSNDLKDDLLVLTGKPGIGKTAILSKIQNDLIQNEITYLSIKCDKFDIEDKDSFSKFFAVENILHSIRQLSRREQVIILIDQLDALSLTMSSNKKTVNIILEFIEQLKYIPNVKIIVSIREYDLKNDPLFKSLDNSNIASIQLLSFEYVNEKLKSFIKESEKINKTLIEILRLPLHLSIFIELYPIDNSCISIKTLQDLYNKLWEQKIQDKEIDKSIRIGMIKLLNSIVEKMNILKKIEVPILLYQDEYEDELNILQSKNILNKEGNKISFFHQTFYDYAFARDFAQKEMSLYDYILTTGQDLIIREQFKQIIQFLRGTDEEKYLLELENIIYSDKVRFHIKFLLVSYLGSLDNPTDKEFDFIQKLFKNDRKYERYFIESWISSDWLTFFKKAEFFTNENFEQYNLQYRLETFVNSKSNLIFEILDTCDCDVKIKSEAIVHSLERLDSWDDYSFNIFKKYESLIYEEDFVRFSLEKLYKKVYSIDEEYAINLFFNYLDIRINEIDDTDKRELLSHDWYKVFKFLMKQGSIKVLENNLSAIHKISKKFKNESSKKEFLITDKIFDSVMWQFDDLHNSTWALYGKTLKVISKLALDNKDVFLQLMKPYGNTKYLSLITISIFGYSKSPEEYKTEILDLFENTKLLEEISIEQDNGYELALLLSNSFNLFSKKEQELIFNSILQVSPKWQNKSFLGRWNKEKVYLGTYRDLQKYKWLYQFDIKEIKRFGYLKQFQELQRKFHWYKFKEPHKSRGGFVGTPLDNDVCLNNWLQSMQVFDGKKSRKNDRGFLRGGKTEHHRQFEKEVIENPDRFYPFLVTLEQKNVHSDYLSAGLNGLIAANYDENKIIKIVHLYSHISDTWLKRNILKAIKYLLGKEILDDSLIDFLENNKNVHCEGIIREKDKFQTIHDHMTSSINSFEGDFAELLPLVYKYVYENESLRNRVNILINEVIEKNTDFVVFGLLRTLESIHSVEKEKFAELLLKIVEIDKVGQFTIYSLQNFHYLYLNNFVSKEQLISYIEKCISFITLVKDREDSAYLNNLGMFLFYYYLTEDSKTFEELLNKAILLNNQVIHGILHQIFEQELHSKEKRKVKISKEFILKFKNNEENDYFYTLSLTKMNGMNFIQDDFDFIKALVSSLHIRREVTSFIEYLQNEYYSDTSLSDKIFELLEGLIKNIDNEKEVRYYDSKQLIEFILELNTRAKSDEKKEKILDLIDSFLISDNLRYSTKSILD